MNVPDQTGSGRENATPSSSRYGRASFPASDNSTSKWGAPE